MSVPFFRNINPPQGSVCNEPDGYISVDILDDYGIKLSQVDAYANGSLAFSGPSTFYSPFTAASSVVPLSTGDGYDGYRLTLVHSDTQNYYFSMRITARNLADVSAETSWNVRTISAIQEAEANPYEVTLRIVFGGPILVNNDFLDVTNYQFNHGMYARYAEIPEITGDGYATEIILWVELFYGRDSFRLDVSDLTDAYGCSITSTFNFSPFESTAHMTNYNGTVRTWHASNVVQADSKRIYLAGEGGIDIFRKITSSRITRWGQIFDSYNIQSMFVSHYGTDYEFVDKTAPILFNQDPAPEGSWDNVGPITLSIIDVATAIEVTDLRIYINDLDVFRGNFNGFYNGYNGSILIGYRSLLAYLYPPVAFVDDEYVYVRVVATDLLGNTLDQIYRFLILNGGFGSGPFGQFPFGT